VKKRVEVEVEEEEEKKWYFLYNANQVLETIKQTGEVVESDCYKGKCQLLISFSLLCTILNKFPRTQQGHWIIKYQQFPLSFSP